MKSSIRHILWTSLVMVLFGSLMIPVTVSAYSYGNPGEEELAEAYIEFKKFVEQGDWTSAQSIVDTYMNEFELYFKDVLSVMVAAFENENKELALSAYQAALRKNVERRFHFAYEQFNDYGQAKLLLAKARGTYKVLEPSAAEKTSKKQVDDMNEAFDTALAALGNPGLFGVGKVESDKSRFEESMSFVIEQLRPLFPVPMVEEGDAHLIEEESDLFKLKDFENNPLWLWLSALLVIVLVVLVFMNRKKKEK